MIDEQRDALAAAYALGALETADAHAFEAQLKGDAELEARVREYREVAALLASGAPAVQASPGLRARLLEQVAAEATKVVPLRPRPRWTAVAWAAAAAGLLLSGVQTVRLRQLDGRVEHLATDFRSAAERRDVLEERLAAILDGRTTMYLMRPAAAPGAPSYGAQLFWRRDQQTWLVHVFDMPRLPANRVYQLWYVTADAKISAGVFEVDEEGHGVKVLHVPAGAREAIAAAISVEPTGGSAQPTGPIVIVGSVAQ